MLFFFNDTATTEIYTLSLHDALPISYGKLPLLALDRALRGDSDESLALVAVEGQVPVGVALYGLVAGTRGAAKLHFVTEDRKSTRLNSSHANISYAVFCLKKKNTALE